MARIPGKVQAYIVMRLAQWGKVTEIIDEVREQYGLEVNKQQVHHYRPDRSDGQPALKWVALWEETRKAYTSRVDDLAIAHRRWRMEKLEKMVEDTIFRKNYPLAAQLLEQAAKEEGGSFTNTRKLGGSAGDALAKLLGVDPGELPPAE